MTTSDKPPKRSLTDAEKDEVLRDIVPILRELRVALADYNLRTHEIERLGSVAANHEERLATVESQVLAGVHSSSWADPMIPVTVEESRPDFLSPPPPRPPTTITGIHDPLVSSQLAAAGTPLRDPVISIGATVIPNVGGAFRLVDGIWSGNSGTWNGHANQVIDWGASKNVTSVEVAYAYGNDDFAEHLSYSLQLSNDPTFATGVTTIASVDSAGTYNGYYYGSMDWFPVAPAVNARYLRVVTATATFDEILVHGH